MKLLRCYAGDAALNLIVPLSGTEQVVDERFYDVSHSNQAYHDIFVKEWAIGERFINIEQDMIVAPTTHESIARLEELWDCPKPWCTIPYFHLKEQEQTPQLTTTYGLGVAKFHEALMRFYPDLIMDTERDADTDMHLHPSRHWIVLADRIASRLRLFGYIQHVHWPVCIHNHRSPEYYLTSIG